MLVDRAGANHRAETGWLSRTRGQNGKAHKQALPPAETLEDEVATVDEASGKISVKLSSTVGSNNATTPTYFKVQDGLVFNSIKPGDKVSFTAECKGGEMAITKLTRE